MKFKPSSTALRMLPCNTGKQDPYQWYGSCFLLSQINLLFYTYLNVVYQPIQFSQHDEKHPAMG